MFARLLFVGLMALATLPSSSGQQMPMSSARVLLAPAPLSDEIAALSVTEYSAGIPRYLTVDLQGHVGTVGKLAGMTIQVWLLRADGTTVAQGKCSDCDSFTSIPPMDGRHFTFAPIPARELAGVVVSVNGRDQGDVVTT